MVYIILLLQLPLPFMSIYLTSITTFIYVNYYCCRWCSNLCTWNLVNPVVSPPDLSLVTSSLLQNWALNDESVTTTSKTPGYLDHLKVILCASEHICSIVRYCFRSFKQL